MTRARVANTQKTKIAAPGVLGTKPKSVPRRRFARKAKQEQELKYTVCSCSGIHSAAAAQVHGLYHCTADAWNGLMTIDQIRQLQIEKGIIVDPKV